MTRLSHDHSGESSPQSSEAPCPTGGCCGLGRTGVSCPVGVRAGSMQSGCARADSRAGRATPASAGHGNLRGVTQDRSARLDIAGELLRYLQEARDGVLSRLDGLGDYDIRRPLTPTGTNLLGLVKHLASIELGYLGDCLGRPSPTRLPWVEDGSIWDSADMWATPHESRADLIRLYQSAWRHSDESISQLGLTAPAHVSWWPDQ